MKTPPSANDSSAKASENIDRMISRLAKAVQKLPLETMISSVWLPGEPEITQNIQKLEADARNAITSLSLLAGSGSQDAVVALRNIGNHAATELESFILPQASKRKRRKISTTPLGFKEQAIFSRPVVEIRGDLSSVVELLKNTESALENLSAKEICDQVEAQDIAGRGRFVVNALVSLGFPKEVLDEHQRNTSVESVHHNHPHPILESQVAKIRNDVDKNPSQKNRDETWIALLKLTQHLLEARLEELAIAKVAELPPKSLDWPICVSAFGRNAHEKIEFLKLGSAARFRPRGVDNKTGHPTVVEPGSVINFAHEYCMALDDVRSMHIHSTEQERADWTESVSGIEKAIKHGVGDNPNEKLLANPTKPPSSDPYHGVSLCILWTFKAALLPAFPSMDNTMCDAQAKAYLELWLDAAMARARMICWNNWEVFKGWPKCVEDRRFQSKKRGRSAQSVVREKLREGMIKLESASAANR